jgi:hypothetical protein
MAWTPVRLALTGDDPLAAALMGDLGGDLGNDLADDLVDDLVDDLEDQAPLDAAG